MKQYQARVKWFSNHYFADEIVIGSKIDMRYDGTAWLYDDDESWFHGMNMTRYEWVEVKEDTIEEIEL